MISEERIKTEVNKLIGKVVKDSESDYRDIQTYTYARDILVRLLLNLGVER